MEPCEIFHFRFYLWFRKKTKPLVIIQWNFFGSLSIFERAACFWKEKVVYGTPCRLRKTSNCFKIWLKRKSLEKQLYRKDTKIMCKFSCIIWKQKNQVWLIKTYWNRFFTYTVYTETDHCAGRRFLELFYTQHIFYRYLNSTTI